MLEFQELGFEISEIALRLFDLGTVNAPGPAAIGLDRSTRFVVGNKYESHFP